MNTLLKRGGMTAVTELRKALMNIDQFGYIICDVLLQLGALCGFLPPVVYVMEGLPHDIGSGSNKYIFRFLPK